MSILRQTTLKGKERLAIGDEIAEIRDKLRALYLISQDNKDND